MLGFLPPSEISLCLTETKLDRGKSDNCEMFERKRQCEFKQIIEKVGQPAIWISSDYCVLFGSVASELGMPGYLNLTNPAYEIDVVTREISRWLGTPYLSK